jgi:hypothetical protein
MRKFFVLFLLAFPAFCSEQAEKDYQSAVDKAKAEFDAKVKVAKDKLVATLKVEMDAATKKGDLDGALKLRDRIAELTPKAVVVPSKPDLASLQEILMNQKWKYIHDNSDPERYNKPLKFESSGKISLGNENEASWRLTETTLEILNQKGEVFGRFTYEQDTGSWISRKGQTDIIRSQVEMLLQKK